MNANLYAVTAALLLHTLPVWMHADYSAAFIPTLFRIYFPSRTTSSCPLLFPLPLSMLFTQSIIWTCSGIGICHSLSMAFSIQQISNFNSNFTICQSNNLPNGIKFLLHLNMCVLHHSYSNGIMLFRRYCHQLLLSSRWIFVLCIQ